MTAPSANACHQSHTLKAPTPGSGRLSGASWKGWDRGGGGTSAPGYDYPFRISFCVSFVVCEYSYLTTGPEELPSRIILTVHFYIMSLFIINVDVDFILLCYCYFGIYINLVVLLVLVLVLSLLS